MFEILAEIIFIGSLIGMGIILIKKIPVLILLADKKTISLKKKKIFLENIKLSKIFSRPKNSKKAKFLEEKKKTDFSADYWSKIRER